MSDPRGRILGALLFACTMALAGCVGTSVDDAPLDDAGAGSERPRIEFEAFDVGTQPHLHDYWVGKERVTLFDGSVDPNTHAMEATLIAAAFDREARAGGVWWLLPEGSIVYEGTGAIEFTASWSDPTVTSLGVAYAPADASEMGPLLPLVNGDTLTIPVTPSMTDMPHSTTSRWQFYFGPVENPSVALSPFDLQIDIVKTREVDLFPGHPELFEGASSKVLFEDSHRTFKASYATRGPYLLENGDFGEPVFAPTHVVPMETVLIRVEVHVTGTEASAGEVTEVRFFHQSAASNTLTAGGMGRLADGDRFVWDVEVTMDMTDSPYASTSQWRFMVEPATQFTGEDPSCGGCVDSALEFDAVITAFATLPEDEA